MYFIIIFLQSVPIMLQVSQVKSHYKHSDPGFINAGTAYNSW